MVDDILLNCLALREVKCRFVKQDRNINPEVFCQHRLKILMILFKKGDKIFDCFFYSDGHLRYVLSHLKKSFAW